MGVSEKQNTDRKLLDFVEFFSQIISSLGFFFPFFQHLLNEKLMQNKSDSIFIPTCLHYANIFNVGPECIFM